MLRTSAAAVLALVFTLPLSAAADLPAGTWFEYSFDRRISGGRDEYFGYTDRTQATGRYEVQAAGAGMGRIHAVYEWWYENSAYEHQRGREDRVAEFRMADRVYTTRTDLDEYDEKTGEPLAVWFWIPPDVQVGQTVRILDKPFVVVSRDARVPDALEGLRNQAIELRGSGADRRDDDYGRFQTTFTDRYWFDAATGFFLGEAYSEDDVGTHENRPASFHLTETVRAKTASYETPPDPMEVALGLAILAAPFVVVLGAVVLAWLLWTRRKIRVADPELGAVTIRLRLPDAKGRLPPVHPGTTAFFGAFLESFLKKALRCGDRVAVATTASGELAGLALYDREAQIGSILAKSTELTEALRRATGAADFFSEHRHPLDARTRDRATALGVGLSTPHAYNLFDTFQVLSLAPIPDLGYDTALVSPMGEADLPDVSAIFERVYRVRARRWLEAQLAGGDVGVVARVGGAIVGLGFAAAAGEEGRLHSLTVLPEHRGAGIGKELVRARLRILKDLGADRVITEIARWNGPSLQIALTLGFRVVGSLWVETTRSHAVDKPIVRR